MDFSVLVAIISGSLLAIVGISLFLAYTGIGQFIGHVLTVFGHFLQATFGTLFTMVASAPSYIKVIFFILIFTSLGAFTYGATIGVTKTCVDGEVYSMDYFSGIGSLMVGSLGTTVLKLDDDQSVEVSGDSVEGGGFINQYENKTYLLIPEFLGSQAASKKFEWRIRSGGVGDDGLWFWQEKNSLKYMICRQYERIPNAIDKLTGACVAWPVPAILESDNGGGCSELDQYSTENVDGRPKYYFDATRADTKGVTLSYDGITAKFDIEGLPDDYQFDDACQNAVVGSTVLGPGKSQVKDISFSRTSLGFFRQGALFGYGQVNFTYSIDNLYQIELASYNDPSTGEKKLLAADPASLSSYYNVLQQQYSIPLDQYVKDNGEPYVNGENDYITYSCEGDLSDRNETLNVFGFPLFEPGFMIGLIVIGILITLFVYLKR